MLQDIQFCTCSRVTGDEMATNQCMIFSFSERALKVLSPDFIENITSNGDPKEKKKIAKSKTIKKNGKSNGNGNGHNHILNEPMEEFSIYKIGDNKWRIPVGQLDHFLISLFRFLPGYFEPMEQQLLMEDGCHPVCCLVSGKKN